MRSGNALAFQVPLNAREEPVVETVDDIDDCDLVYANEHVDDDIQSDTNIYDLMDDGSICRAPIGHKFERGLCIYCGDPVPGSGAFKCGPV